MRHVKVFNVDFSSLGAQSDNGKVGRVIADGELSVGVVTSEDLMQDL